MALKLVRAFLLFALSATIACAQSFSMVQVVNNPTSISGAATAIQLLNMGGGGYSTGFDMGSDGTIFQRIDIFGAYIGSTVVGTTWQQMATSTRLPSSYTSTPTPFLGSGAWEVKIDPSNSNNLWMMYVGQEGRSLTNLLKSTNKGASWSTTGFPINGVSAQDSFRAQVGQRIVVDPNNSNVVWASTNTALYVSQDGGTTFTQNTNIPAAVQPGYVGMQFDPTSTVTGGKTTRLIVGVSGSGVYISTNANNGSTATWTLVTSSSTTPGKGKIASDGNYYFNVRGGSSNSLFRINTSGTLATLATSNTDGIWTFAIDPNNPARIAMVMFGRASVGGPVNGSPTWTSENLNYTISATDAPWQVNGKSPQSDGEIYFDPFNTTSSSSVTIGTGTQTFTVAAGLNIATGDLLRVTNTGTPANYMLGTVSSYSGTTLSISVLSSNPGGYLGNATGGSGTFTAWTITKERIWSASGFGFFWFDGLYSTAAYVYNSQNFGVNDPVARQVIWPPSGKPVLATADLGTWYVPNQPVGATTGLPGFLNNSFTLREGTAIDWTTSTPGTIELVMGGSSLVEGSNTSGGANGSWTSYTTTPGVASFVAATDTSNIIAANTSGLLYTTNGGSTAWTAYPSAPTSTWSIGNTSNPNTQPICADRVTAGTFYGYNGSNVYKFVLPGATIATQHTGALDGNGVFANILKCVPGNSGHLFYSYGNGTTNGAIWGSGIAGVVSYVPSAATYPFRFSGDGGVTWTSLSGVADALAFGFGAAAQGQSYPAIFIAGWVSGTYGIWRCDNFNPASPASSCTWNNVGTLANGWMDIPTTLEGDPNQWGRFIIGHQGSGYSIGYIPGQPNTWP